MVPTTSSRNQPEQTGESAQGFKWCSKVPRYFFEQIFAYWPRPAPKPNLCTTWVPSTSIRRVRRYSPTCANYALQRTARDNVSQYREATKAVLENFYMDDYLDSVESPERALKRSKELVHFLHFGGFKLTKFVS